MAKNKMSSEEIASWNRLCDYVKYNIMRYDTSQKTPKYLALKLKGLQRGQHIVNNNIESSANYSFDVIYTAFVMNRADIVNYIDTHHIKDERHLINLIVLLVEKHLNDTYQMIQRQKKAADNIEHCNLDNQFSNGSDFRSAEKVTANRMQDLW